MGWARHGRQLGPQRAAAERRGEGNGPAQGPAGQPEAPGRRRHPPPAREAHASHSPISLPFKCHFFN